MIGESALRLEDRPLLTGAARFVGDLNLHGQLHLRVVRSPVAHGRINWIDTSAALAEPGVVAILTAADVAHIPPIAFRQATESQLLPYRQPILARDVVRYVGEPIACVLAVDGYLAEDAADLVDVDIESLPAQVDPLAEPSAWNDEVDTEALLFEVGYGDVAAAFAAAAHTVEIEVKVGRHTGVPLECRGALAEYDPGTDLLTLHGAAKVPFYNRDAIAAMLGLAPAQVVLRECHVGGGFGVRGELYPEDVLVCVAARRFGRPVKWIEDRQEHLVAANHSRDQLHRIRAAVDDDARVLAIDDEFWLDQGAYVRTHAATVPTLTAAMLAGPYTVPAFRCTGHVRLTNKTPAGTYRAPGRYEGTFARERLLDAVAAALDVAPEVVRERNYIPAAAMPFERGLTALGTPVVYDSGDYAGLAAQAIAAWDLPALRDRLKSRRAEGELVGVGLACFVEKSGLGPYEGARVSVDARGLVEIVTGGASMGQGFETIAAQVAGDVLGIPIERVRVVHGQTDRFDFGMGAFASRLTVMAGSAVHRAAEAVRDKALRVAAEMLEIAPGDLALREGRVVVAGSEHVGVELGEIAARLTPHGAAALGLTPGLAEDGWYFTDHMTYPYGTHLAEVAIDAGTGKVSVTRYLVAYDVGRAINPTLVAGQLVGGAAQGLGGALLEEFRYTPEGQPTATTFVDYLLPSVADMPTVEILLTEDAPSPLNPLGVKGAGEGGTTAFGAAVAAAVDDALGRPGSIRSLPITPETIRALLRSGGNPSTEGRGTHDG